MLKKCCTNDNIMIKLYIVGNYLEGGAKIERKNKQKKK